MVEYVIFMIKGKVFLLIFFFGLLMLPLFQSQLFFITDKISFKLNYQVDPIPAPANNSSVLSAATGKVTYPQDYTIILVGDSMTQFLGNSDELRGYLKQYYPQKSFEILNYGYGATSLLSVQERIENKTYYGRDYMPIKDIDFDVLILESFGHNPLSEFPLEEGLRKQEEILDKIVETLKNTNPQAKLLFLATIAPNRDKYGEGQVELGRKAKIEWAEERNAYIKNHIKYAKEHNIPLINVYEKSMDDSGNGKLIFISDKDYIHPSPSGVIFISGEIAKFLFEERILN